MSLPVGTRLGPYEILATLGAGGMGEVYKARDTRLDRTVALKVLSRELTGDPTAGQRFEREARAIAALSHLGICPLFDIGHQDGTVFLVMEYLDGETLATRLSRGKLPLDEALTNGIQIAEALAAAHRAGIVHRDLKPGNIMLTAAGAKLLDFGLAKRRAEPLARDATVLETEPLTRAGMILGTVQYMAPEQLEGRDADERTDIFAFGVVLYEMLTGRRAFEGTSHAALIGNILHAEPPAPSSSERLTPTALDELVRVCLAKDPTARCQSMTDVQARLAAARQLASTPRRSDAQTVAAFVRRRWVAASMLTILTSVVIVVIVVALSRSGSRAGTVGSASFPNLQIQPLTLTGDVASGAISPDGKFIAYVRKDAGLWVRQVAAENDVQIAPSVKGPFASVTFTPDGNSIDFAATEGVKRELWRVPLLGGTARSVVQDIWSSPGWSPDGRRMAFVRTKGADQGTSLIVADEDGRHEQILVTRPAPGFLNESWGVWGVNHPDWSPDGKQLILAGIVESKAAEIVSGFMVVDATTGAETRTVPINAEGLAWEAAWLDDRQILLNISATLNSPPSLWWLDLPSVTRAPITREFAYFHGISLTADRRSAVTTRTDRRSGIWLGTTLGEDGAVVIREAPSGPTAPVVDADGGIVYSAYTGTGVMTLYRVPSGASKPTVLGEGGAAGFTTTSDGRFVVFSSSPQSPMYRVNNDGTGLMKLVDRNAAGPTITPDGKAVLFSPFGSPGLFSVAIEGGTVRELTKLYMGSAPSVSPDGRRLLIAGGKPGVCILCDLPDCTYVKELELKSSKWAPDGRGVAYINDQDHGNLWEQPLNGDPPHALTRFEDAKILEFGWSPDYKRLVLSRGRVSDDLVLLKGLR